MLISRERIEELELFAARIRLEAFRSILAYGAGHVGGSLSMSDALAVLYGEVMRVDPGNPRMEDRDRFVLSKGHAGPGLYAALALRGFFPVEELLTLNQPHTRLPSHCDMNKTPGVDMTSGSLGQGLSAAAGIALAAKIQGKDYDAYAMIGDGECDEGQVWECLLFAAHHKLDHLIALLDYNGMQLDGPTSEVCDLGDLPEKFRSFGWFVQEVDGHSAAEICEALMRAKACRERPSAVVLHTVKGYGCEMALAAEYNHNLRFRTPEQREAGQAELLRMEEIVRRLAGRMSADGQA